MITDLANLGPSIRTTSDLGAGAKKGPDKNSQSEKSGSFDQILQKKLPDSDQGVRTNYAKPDPAPIQKDLEKAKPEKVDAEQVKTRANTSNEPRTAPTEKQRDEPGSVSDKGRSEKSESANRQEVMLEFMDSMESEFGIPPARMVEAMTNLSDSQLKASPEDTASQVIAQLDLPKEDEPKAYAMYMSLLAQLNQLSAPQQAQSSLKPIVVAGTGGAAAVLAQPVSHQQRRSALNSSLDQMNQKFFMQGGPDALKPQSGPEAMTSQRPEIAERFQPERPLMPEQQPVLENLTPLPPQEIAKPVAPPYQGTEKMTPEMMLQQRMQAVDPNSAEAKELTKRLAALSAAAVALGESPPAEAKSMSPVSGNSAVATTGALSAAAIAAATFSSAKGEDSDEKGDSSGNSPSQNPFMAHQPPGHLAQQARTDAASSVNHNFGAMMAAASAEGAQQAAGQGENKAAIQQLMNQAQFMVKKGGGEAKVQLNPEGLGEIHMKVSVNEGKVGIQMSAETKEAKKLIESSLNDLRANLDQHKLSVEHVKVDVGNQTSGDRNSEGQSQQRQMDARQEQSGRQAQDFWSQFNDGGERRSAFQDSPGLRAYGGSRKVEPLTPGSTTSVSAKRYAGSGKGRGLDLVA